MHEVGPCVLIEYFLCEIKGPYVTLRDVMSQVKTYENYWQVFNLV